MSARASVYKSHITKAHSVIFHRSSFLHCVMLSIYQPNRFLNNARQLNYTSSAVMSSCLIYVLVHCNACNSIYFQKQSQAKLHLAGCYAVITQSVWDTSSGSLICFSSYPKNPNLFLTVISISIFNIISYRC